MLRTIWNIGRQEPSIGVGQEVVNGVTLWNRTIVLDGVDVVVGGRHAEFGLQQSGRNEHQARRNHQLLRLGGDQHP